MAGHPAASRQAAHGVVCTSAFFTAHIWLKGRGTLVKDTSDLLRKFQKSVASLQAGNVFGWKLPTAGTLRMEDRPSAEEDPTPAYSPAFCASRMNIRCSAAGLFAERHLHAMYDPRDDLGSF